MADKELFDRVARLYLVTTSSPDPERFKIAENPATGIRVDCYGGVGQRIEFEIERSLTKRPNRCRITVTNLNPDSRALLKEDNLRIHLEAGYRDEFSKIFTGDVTYAVSTLDGPDWRSEMECGDGDRLYAHARVNKSYKPGTRLGTVVEDIFKSTGQKVPDKFKSSDLYQKSLTSGFVAFGKYPDVLSELLRSNNYSWSIQDGQPQILQEGSVDTQTFLVDERHGMIGSPEFGHPERKKKPATITVTLALYPAIRPGHLAVLDTRDIKGNFKILKVKHMGDTHGQDWKTQVEITPTDKRNR